MLLTVLRILTLCLLISWPALSAAAPVDLTGEWRTTNTSCQPGTSTLERVWITQHGLGFSAALLASAPCHAVGTIVFHGHETLNRYYPNQAWVAIGTTSAPSSAQVTARWALLDPHHLTLTTSQEVITWTRTSGPIALGGQVLGLTNVRADCRNRTTGESRPAAVLAGNHLDCDALPTAPGERVQLVITGGAE